MPNVIWLGSAVCLNSRPGALASPAHCFWGLAASGVRFLWLAGSTPTLNPFPLFAPLVASKNAVVQGVGVGARGQVEEYRAQLKKKPGKGRRVQREGGREERRPWGKGWRNWLVLAR